MWPALGAPQFCPWCSRPLVGHGLGDDAIRRCAACKVTVYQSRRIEGACAFVVDSQARLRHAAIAGARQGTELSGADSDAVAPRGLSAGMADAEAEPKQQRVARYDISRPATQEPTRSGSDTDDPGE